MGQLIEVQPRRLGAITIFDTDRSLSGQDGETYTRSDPAGASFPARLATAVFEADAAVTSVFVYSNTASIQRSPDWSEADATAIASVIRNFFTYYEDNRQ